MEVGRVTIGAAVLTLSGLVPLWQGVVRAQQPDRGQVPTAPVGGEARGGRQGGAGRGGGGGGLANKNRDLPAGAFTASSTVAHTMLQHEWVDVRTQAARETTSETVSKVRIRDGKVAEHWDMRDRKGSMRSPDMQWCLDNGRSDCPKP